MVLPTPPDSRAVALVQAIYDLFVAANAWPDFGELDSYLYARGEPNCEKTLQALPKGLVNGAGPGSHYFRHDHTLSLTIAGLASCGNAADDVEVFLLVLNLAVELEAEGARSRQEARLTADDVTVRVHLPASGQGDLVVRAGAIFQSEHPGWTTFSGEAANWSCLLGREVRRFIDVTTVDEYWQKAHPDLDPAEAQQPVREQPSPSAFAPEESPAETANPALFDVMTAHPWVARAAASLWESGHRSEAVREAARAIEVELRKKLGATGGTAIPLISNAFSRDDPRPGGPRLRFRQFDGRPDDWTNSHDGALALGRGCFMLARNLPTHGYDPDDAELVESLAALSLLARWIDRAEVAHFDEP